MRFRRDKITNVLLVMASLAVIAQAMAFTGAGAALAEVPQEFLVKVTNTDAEPVPVKVTGTAHVTGDVNVTNSSLPVTGSVNVANDSANPVPIGGDVNIANSPTVKA